MKVNPFLTNMKNFLKNTTKKIKEFFADWKESGRELREYNAKKLKQLERIQKLQDAIEKKRRKKEISVKLNSNDF